MDTIVGVCEWTSGIEEHVACKVSAKSGVENKLLGLEVLVDVAGAFEKEQGNAKISRIWMTVKNGRRNPLARKKPNFNEPGGALHNINAARSLVKAGPKTAGRALNLTARRAGSLAAVRISDLAGHKILRGVKKTLGLVAGVHRDIVHTLKVDSLNDVNLAVLGPVLAYAPERRPHTADTARHVLYVSNEETITEGLFAADADRLPARA